MRKYATIVLLLAALLTAAFTLFGDDSISKMRALARSVELQRSKNAELSDVVRDLRSTVRGLRSDPRALEKAARNELGMARPNERIFVFEKNPPENASR